MRQNAFKETKQYMHGREGEKIVASPLSASGWQQYNCLIGQNFRKKASVVEKFRPTSLN